MSLASFPTRNTNRHKMTFGMDFIIQFYIRDRIKYSFRMHSDGKRNSKMELKRSHSDWLLLISFRL